MISGNGTAAGVWVIELSWYTAGTDISTYPLAPASKFLKKGPVGKFIVVYTFSEHYTVLYRKWHKC